MKREENVWNKSLLIEKCIGVPFESRYGYHFINWEKTYEYNRNIRDILRGDEDIRNKLIEQLVLYWDYLIKEFKKYKSKLQSSGNDNLNLKRSMTDQIDGYFNLVSHILTEVNGGFRKRIIEQSVWTPKIFNKILELFDIQFVADILAKDNVIYREVLKIFINEHPQLLDNIHE